MLTAIVVAVATFGVSLALIIRIYMQYGTLEEDEIVTSVSTP
jgi:multicomponent Na+:H+ antiporter subunit C